jgi:hypothetical protein
VEPGGRATLSIPLADGDRFHLRAHLFVASDFELVDLAVFHLGAPGTDVGLNVDIQADARYEVFFPESDESVRSEPGTLLKDEWVCLELAVVVSDTAGEATLRVDGSQLAMAQGVDTRPPGGIELFTLGIDWSQSGQEAANVWLDDVVLDDEPLPCPD